MKRFTFFVVLAIAVLCSSLTPLGKQNSFAVNVTVNGLRNNSGQVAVKIFNSSVGFPEKTASVVKSVLITPKNNKAVFTISDLPAGTYAIALMHDENKNTIMDKTMFGVPKEGFGFSQNPKISFSAPSFSDCAFKIDGSNKDLSIKIIYY